jgi:hypothetical protein
LIPRKRERRTGGGAMSKETIGGFDFVKPERIVD